MLNRLEHRFNEPVFLTGWYPFFEEGSHIIRPLLFGVLVELAEGKLQEFRGDLFHDAKWLEENVNGPIKFPFMVRHSGTHIGDQDVQTAIDIKSPGMIYDIELTCRRGAYYVTVTERTRESETVSAQWATVA
jgi:hypothetical protein